MNTTIQELTQTLEELNQYKRDKSQLLIFYINERLNKSLRTYYKTMVDSFNYAAKQNELKLMRTLKNK